MNHPPQSFENAQLSVIIITSDNYDSIRKTISYLQKQTVQNQIELVIVAPSLATLELNTNDVADFYCYQVIEVGKIVSIGSSYAAGVRHAKADIIALAEDHCFPEPDWAEQLIQTHQQDYVAVGPALSNANPSTAVSWADMLIAYVPWMHPAISQTVNFLPGHNSSYKKDILLSYGDRLDEMLESETVLHWDLRSQGYELYLEAKAKTAHTNFARLLPWLPIQFRAGRIFAASRAEMEFWSGAKRVVYVLASPLIPVVRTIRILQALNQGERKQVKMAWGTLFITMLGLVADGLGQMVGYGLGHGNTLQQYADAEFHRELHLAQSDREDLNVSF